MLTKVDWIEEHWWDVDDLDGDELHGVDGRDREGRGLLVVMVQLVEVLVQEGHVVHPVVPVGDVVLPLKKKGGGGEEKHFLSLKNHNLFLINQPNSFNIVVKGSWQVSNWTKVRSPW